MTTRSHVLHAMCYCNEYCETEDVPLEDTNETTVYINDAATLAEG